MGIDVFLQWDGKEKGEGNDADYLREAYIFRSVPSSEGFGIPIANGGVITREELVQGITNEDIYATKCLFKEAWINTNEVGGVCDITGEELTKRLPKAKEITKERFRIHGYNPEKLPVKLKAMDDFVELFIQKRKRRTKTLGTSGLLTYGPTATK